jgi:hypothetical protein
MKKRKLVKETKFTITTFCTVELDDSYSEFDICQNYSSKSEDEVYLLNEIVYFIRKSSKFPKRNFKQGQVLSTQIYFESFVNYENVSEFYKLLKKRVEKIDYYDIDCSVEVFLNLNEDQRNNITCPGIIYEYNSDKGIFDFTIR